MSIEKSIETLTEEVSRLADVISEIKNNGLSLDGEVSANQFRAEPNNETETGEEKPSGGSKKKKSSKKKTSSKGRSTNNTSEEPNNASGEEAGDGAGGTEYSQKDVQSKLLEVGQKKGRDGIKAVLNEFDVGNARELEPNQYAAVIKAADEKINE